MLKGPLQPQADGSCSVPNIKFFQCNINAGVAESPTYCVLQQRRSRGNAFCTGGTRRRPQGILPRNRPPNLKMLRNLSAQRRDHLSMGLGRNLRRCLELARQRPVGRRPCCPSECATYMPDCISSGWAPQANARTCTTVPLMSCLMRGTSGGHLWTPHKRQWATACSCFSKDRPPVACKQQGCNQN